MIITVDVLSWSIIDMIMPSLIDIIIQQSEPGYVWMRSIVTWLGRIYLDRVFWLTKHILKPIAILWRSKRRYTNSILLTTGKVMNNAEMNLWLATNVLWTPKIRRILLKEYVCCTSKQRCLALIWERTSSFKELRWPRGV